MKITNAIAEILVKVSTYTPEISISKVKMLSELFSMIKINIPLSIYFYCRYFYSYFQNVFSRYRYILFHY